MKKLLMLIVAIHLLLSGRAFPDEPLTLKIAKLEPIPTNQPFSFIVYGDTKENATVHKRLMNMFFKEKDANDVAFILHTGDLVKDGSEREEWKEYFIDVVQPIAERIPYFPVIGNHDYEEEGKCDNFAKLFSQVRNRVFPKNSVSMAYDFWYSFVYGNSIFIILDANLMTYDEDFHIPKKRAERQYHWLEKVLKSASKDAKIKHKFIFFHQAPFVSAKKKVLGFVAYHLDDAEKLRKYKIGKDFFLDIFRKYDADVLFLGHIHYYERWVEQYEKDGNKRRITWVTTGGGGAKNEMKWHGFTLGMRPPMVLTKKERNERIRPYNRRARRAKNVTNWSLFQGYPTKKSETVRALEEHYCIVHVDGDTVWMEVKNKQRKLIETAILKKPESRRKTDIFKNMIDKK